MRLEVKRQQLLQRKPSLETYLKVCLEARLQKEFQAIPLCQL